MENPYEPPQTTPGAEPTEWQPEAPRRPTAILVIGILNIVFGALGLICNPIKIVGSLVPTPEAGAPEMAGMPPEQSEMMRKLNEVSMSPAVKTYQIFDGGIGFLFSAILLAAGIGLLVMKPWGRTLSLVYAFYGIAAAIATMVFSWMMIITPLFQLVEQAPDPQAKQIMQFGAYGGMGGALAQSCFSAVYPVVILIVLTRPSITRALQGLSPKRPSEFA